MQHTPIASLISLIVLFPPLAKKGGEEGGRRAEGKGGRNGKKWERGKGKEESEGRGGKKVGRKGNGESEGKGGKVREREKLSLNLLTTPRRTPSPFIPHLSYCQTHKFLSLLMWRSSCSLIYPRSVTGIQFHVRHRGRILGRVGVRGLERQCNVSCNIPSR